MQLFEDDQYGGPAGKSQQHRMRDKVPQRAGCHARYFSTCDQIINRLILSPLISGVEKHYVNFNVFESIDIFFLKGMADSVYHRILLR